MADDSNVNPGSVQSTSSKSSSSFSEEIPNDLTVACNTQPTTSSNSANNTDEGESSAVTDDSDDDPRYVENDESIIDAMSIPNQSSTSCNIISGTSSNDTLQKSTRKRKRTKLHGKK